MKASVCMLSCLLCLSSVAGGAEDCGWLATAEVDRAFPEQAPWRAMVGGEVGSCKFLSAPGMLPSTFGANQMVKASDAEAEEMIRSLRTSMIESYDVKPAPALGPQGFRYKAKSEAEETGARFLFFAGHRSKIVVIGSLTWQSPITPAVVDAAQSLIRAALAITDDDEVLSAASACRFFDPALIQRLLPAEDFSQHVFGDTSCMAQAGGKVLIMSVVEGIASETVTRMTEMDSHGCDHEPIPDLGEDGSIVSACSAGRPKAVVRFLSGSKMFTFSLAVETQPTDKEKTLLVELAKRSVGL